MRSPRRFAAGAAALAALCLGATACDSSPYAATVNGQVIKEAALNAELRTWADNSAYVQAFDSSNSSSGITVTGDAPDTFNGSWVANILNGIIRANVIHQHLSATGNLPSGATVDAARSVSEISQVGWYDFPSAFQATLAERTAEAATLQSPAVPAQTLESVFHQYEAYFFSQICTLQASAFTKVTAEAVASNGVSDGTQQCYDQEQLEELPAVLRAAIMNGTTGSILPPVATSYGYEVVKVVSRVDQGFTPEVQSVLAYAIEQAEGTTEPALMTLLARSHIRVDPAYGTWNGTQVVPLSAPGAQSSSQ